MTLPDGVMCSELKDHADPPDAADRSPTRETAASVDIAMRTGAAATLPTTRSGTRIADRLAASDATKSTTR